MAQLAEVRRPRWKTEEVEDIAQHLREYPVVAVFDLRGLRANIIHEMRKRLRGSCVIRVSRKSLFLKACELAGRPELKKLVEDLQTPVGYILSKISSFQLSMILEKEKVPMFAKAGERADFDVWVSETNTGLPPGPILSDFGKLKIPTRIEGGQVWIAKDTKVASKGDEISPLLASMLVKLGVKSVLRGISILRAYEDGIILNASDLKIDVEAVGRQLAEAYILSLEVAAAASYITVETIAILLVKSSRHAQALAEAAGYISRDNIEALLLKAERSARALASRAGH
ncbi:50S ribosomal protein L10 [archaeon HR01]|nr:50S ribosomal protein L10 [archaeon HR01]